VDRLPLGQECCRCRTWKLYDEFNRDKSRKSGFAPLCKACRRADRKANADRNRRYGKDYRERNAEKLRAYYARYNAEHSEHYRLEAKRRREERPEEHRAAARARYAADKQKASDKNRRWRLANAERRQEYMRAYREDNRDKLAFYASRREEWKRSNGGDGFSHEQWIALCGEYGNRCLRCGADGKLEPDHVIPLCKGGPHDIGNIQPLCRSCNATKRDRAWDFRDAA